MAEIFTTINGEDFVGADEAAKLLGIKKSYLYQLTHEKRIPYYKYGPRTNIFKVSEITSFMNGRIRPILTYEQNMESAQEYCARHPIGR